MLSAPVARSGVVQRAVRFHESVRPAGVAVVFVRFTVPAGEGGLVRNMELMRAVGDAQEAFRPDSVGAQLIEEMSTLARCDRVVDNQKLSGLAAADEAVHFASLANLDLTTAGCLTAEQVLGLLR